jgi:hypothetical protein
LAHISWERQAILAPSFAAYRKLTRFPVNIIQSHVHDFTGTQAESRQQQQYRPVALPGKTISVASLQ